MKDKTNLLRQLKLILSLELISLITQQHVTYLGIQTWYQLFRMI